MLDELVKRIERDPRITYYAVNRQGDLRTNTHSEGPNAVTWGVFPGKEIVQPTIVEAVSFIAWKDEAFELGVQWASLYPEGSESRKMIQQVMDTSYLVNIVANDFKDGMSIFEPFQLERADALPPLAKSEPVASVVPTSIGGVAQAIKNSAAIVKETAQSAVTSVQEKVTGNGHASDAKDSVASQPNGTGRLATPPNVNESTTALKANAKESGSPYDVDAPTKSDAVDKTEEEIKPNTEVADGMPTITEGEINSAIESRMNQLLHPTGPTPRKRYTPADLDALFDDVPLFMRDNSKAANTDNENLEALKTLVFEGSGDEVATNFKNHAVENHQQGKLREALAQYTQGLEANPEDPKLIESLLLNRAACNLSLGMSICSRFNYLSSLNRSLFVGNNGSVLRDTSAVLKLNPDSPKAYFRASSALLDLGRWDDALKCIAFGRQLESEKESSKQAMWDGLEQKAKNGLRKTAEKEERVRRDKLSRAALQQAIRVSAILMELITIC